jgi:MFS family permease
MDIDLNISSSDYQWFLTIFYIAYIVFEWFALMWKVIPPHMWAAFCVTGWGIVATCQAATTSFSGMMSARFFLGFFEAGFGPGVPYLLSFFYLRHEIGLRIGVFLSAAPLATCFAGALAYGITSGDDSHRIKNWRVLFLAEGLPCILAGISTYFILPDSTEKASFLNEEERTVARARGIRQVGEEEAHRIGYISFNDVGAALLDLKVGYIPLALMLTQIPFRIL